MSGICETVDLAVSRFRRSRTLDRRIDPERFAVLRSLAPLTHFAAVAIGHAPSLLVHSAAPTAVDTTLITKASLAGRPVPTGTDTTGMFSVSTGTRKENGRLVLGSARTTLGGHNLQLFTSLDLAASVEATTYDTLAIDAATRASSDSNGSTWPLSACCNHRTDWQPLGGRTGRGRW